MKAVFTVALALILVSGSVWAQDFAVDKKAMIISGTVEFDRYSGDSYKTTDANGNETDEALTTFAFLPAFDYFVARNFFIGGTLQFMSASQGDASTSTFGIGPEIGYAMGNADSRVFPFGKVAFLYASDSYDNGQTTTKITGTDIAITLGLIAPLQEHIGIIPEISYHIMSSKGDWDNAETMGDNRLSIGVGISGLIH